MWVSVAGFELRQQLRSHVFAVVFCLSAALVFGSVVAPQIRIGPLAGEDKLGPAGVIRTHLIWSLFYLFTATAFAADAVLRDEQTRFAPLIAATGVRARPYLLGRFAGAFAAVVLCFLSVPLGLAAAAAVSHAGTPVESYGVGLFVLALPNLFFSSALFFALATVTRSMMAAYLGAVGLLMLYGLGGGFGTGGAGARAGGLLDPFATAAVSGAEAWLPGNRALWVGVGLITLAVPAARFRFSSPSMGEEGTRSAQAEWGGGGASVRVERCRDSHPHPPTALTRRGPLPPPSRGRGVEAFDLATTLAQLAARTAFEVGQVVRSPAFAVLGLLGLFNAAAALWRVSPPDTLALVARLIDAFRLVPIVVAVFYAGELMWSEREHRVEPLIASAPIPSFALFLPKAAALALVLLGLLAVTGVTLVVVQSLRGGAVRPDQLVRWYLLPRAYDWLLPASLALFLQAVAPNKLAGWGWMVLYLIGSLTLENLGLNGGLYRYGGHLDGPLTDTLGSSAPPHPGLLRLYWGAFAVLLLSLSGALWGRGLESAGGRLRSAARALRGPLRAVSLAAALAFIGLGLALVLSSGGR